MELEQKEINGVCIVKAAGMITDGQAERLKKYVLSCIGKYKRFILNFSEVTVIDRTCIAVLVELFRRIRQEQGVLMIACVQTLPRTLFYITSADRLFDVQNTVHEALCKLNAGSSCKS